MRSRSSAYPRATKRPCACACTRAMCAPPAARPAPHAARRGAALARRGAGTCKTSFTHRGLARLGAGRGGQGLARRSPLLFLTQRAANARKLESVTWTSDILFREKKLPRDIFAADIFSPIFPWLVFLQARGRWESATWTRCCTSNPSGRRCVSCVRWLCVSVHRLA